MKNVLWIMALFLLGALLIACFPQEAEENVDMPNTMEEYFDEELEEFAMPEILEPTDSIHHIHGLSFLPNQENKLYIATHHGVVLYDITSKEAFYVGESRDDYMGFKRVGDTSALMSSGHPGVGSDLPDPLGFMWSEDLGQSWEYRSLLGAFDFHALAASYQNDQHIMGFALDYSRGGHEGLILRSQDGGYTWDEIENTGLYVSDHGVLDISFSPESDEVIYAATVKGLMKSIDGGHNFKAIHDNIVTALKVIDNETVLFYDENEKTLVYMHKDEFNTISLDENQVPINYITLKEKGTIKTMVVSTMDSSIYLTTNGGETWSSVVRSGTID